MNNATTYTYFDDVTLVGPFLHVHVHVLRVTKPLYCIPIIHPVQPCRNVNFYQLRNVTLILMILYSLNPMELLITMFKLSLGMGRSLKGPFRSCVQLFHKTRPIKTFLGNSICVTHVIVLNNILQRYLTFHGNMIPHEHTVIYFIGHRVFQAQEVSLGLIDVERVCLLYPSLCHCRACAASDMGLSASVPLPIVMGIFVLLGFQSS